MPAPATAALRRRGPSGGSDAALAALFSKVQLSRALVSQLEQRMKQQVRAALDAQAKQQRSLALGADLDAPWRSVGGVGCLRAFKRRGRDEEAGALPWPTTASAPVFDVEASAVGRSQATGGIYASYTGAAGVRHMLSRMGNVNAAVDGEGDEDMQAFRVFGRVQGNYRDIVDAHLSANSADCVQQQKLLSPFVTDAAVLRSIHAGKDSYFGIKWVCEASPSSIVLSSGSSSVRRDCCFLEMVGFTADSQGRETGFVAYATVDVPECPPFPDFMRVARFRVERTLLVRATDSTIATSELFIMAASDDAQSASSLAINARIRVMMTILNDISLVIDSQNLVKQSLIAPKSWVPDDSRIACSVCSRGFHFLRRRHHCRLCGELVCKTCFVLRNVPCADFSSAGDPAPLPFMPAATQPVLRINPQRREGYRQVGLTKFCVRCVMSLRTVDKRLDAFSQEISKLISISNASFLLHGDIESSAVTASTYSSMSPSTRGRGSSVTYYRRGSNETREFNLDDLFEDHIKASHSEVSSVSDNQPTPGTSDNKLLTLHELSASLIKKPNPAKSQLSSEPTTLRRSHSGSQSKLVRLSQLSRSSSASRILAELYDRPSSAVG